ncbi:ATP-dependent DNA helicase DinG [Dongia mobilis]|uniref:ATP-dependent DNA helicase DinG n=1 Tax=Dongia mobilis TaxID=578943 RepID=A0A4R6WQN1_9PROT|nr:ATP-dependent DNA helicase [Dongia mobilis]TDQ82086.1 ATP-dependent DNA helicase DinG [Dongia mobilis]
MNESGTSPDRIVPLADLPALLALHGAALWLERGDAAPEHVSQATVALSARARAPLLVHGPACARRLRTDRFAAFDLLELYAFVRPASFCLPTAKGLAEALGLAVPTHHDAAAEIRLLHESARLLLGELRALNRQRRRVIGLAWAMARAGWAWAPLVLAALDFRRDDGKPAPGIGVWDDLPEWADGAPPPEPGHQPVQAEETRRRLAELTGAHAEQRAAQADFSAGLVPAFTPRAEEGAPQVVLAEAGTGVGKTLGYIAPASLWAERNQGPVWISTYTRHLQHQIDQELDRLYPNPAQKAQKVVIRKGRENYLCLLNLAEMGAQLSTRPVDAVGFGLAARWVMATRDGDMVGGDFPGWLPDLIGPGRSLSLADRRGECIYAACPHYTRCFIERSVRRAKKAEIVIANHALVMIQAALNGGAEQSEEQRLPTRYVFDEGHHLFSATDSAFAAHLTGQEMTDLRRWLLGAEGGRSSRARGLKRRLDDLLLDDAEMPQLVEDVLAAAKLLAGEGWQQRVIDGQPLGAGERFLLAVRHQVLARSASPRSGYSLECATAPLEDAVALAAVTLERGLKQLTQPMLALAARLMRRLDEEADSLDSAQRQRLDALARGLVRRADGEAGAWRHMLAALTAPMAEDEREQTFVDWFGLERSDGRELDLGMYRHFLDPTLPFAETVMKPAHGIVVTSATLTDGSGSELAWAGAEARAGTVHLPLPAYRLRVPSPFDYARQTRVIIVTDLDKDDMAQVAAAYRTLFLAARGGALGLFTAIQRLREVHRRIAPALEQAGLNLLAQHVDAMDNATLIDIFRGDRDACLLGTDAVRDGVDVPGDALRLIVFDRVPWPRPDLLHRARKQAFGGTAYEDQLTRLKLKQAFGRLIRRADDRGVFVLLDKAMPSRLLSAFPAEITVERIGLKDAIAGVRAFLGPA